MRLLGIGEIAHLLDVQRGTVGQWRFRQLLPDPDQKLQVTPAWWDSTIRAWAMSSGRLDIGHWDETMKQMDEEDASDDAR